MGSYVEALEMQIRELKCVLIDIKCHIEGGSIVVVPGDDPTRTAERLLIDIHRVIGT